MPSAAPLVRVVRSGSGGERPPRARGRRATRRAACSRALGDPDRFVYSRSSMKPLQAAVSLRRIPDDAARRPRGGDVRFAQRRARPRAGRPTAPARRAASPNATSAARPASRSRSRRCATPRVLAAIYSQLLRQARRDAPRLPAVGARPRQLPAAGPPAAARDRASGSYGHRCRAAADRCRRLRRARPRSPPSRARDAVRPPVPPGAARTPRRPGRSCRGVDARRLRTSSPVAVGRTRG